MFSQITEFGFFEKFLCFGGPSEQNLVHGARKSPLTNFFPRMGPLLVHLTLEKWAIYRLTMCFCKILMLMTKIKLGWSMETQLY